MNKRKKAKRQKHYLHIIVVAHGASEFLIAKSIRAILKIPMEIYSNQSGNLPYQITDLKKLFSGKDFTSGFYHKFQSNVEFKKNRPVNLKIFTIMDKDNIPDDTYQQYKNNTLLNDLSSCYVKKFVIPIFNENNLEDVIKNIGMKYPKNNKAKYNTYKHIFSVGNNSKITPKDKIEEFADLLKKCNKTNMDEFVCACLEEEEKFNRDY